MDFYSTNRVEFLEKISESSGLFLRTSPKTNFKNVLGHSERSMAR